MREKNDCTIILEKNGYEPFLDYLKGISILFVVLTHCLPKLDYMLFSLWGAQAVPLFLLIQTWHVCKKSDETIKMPKFKKLFNRILKPFIILLFVELFLQIVVLHTDPISVIKSTIINGGIGPGCYWVWIYIQFAFIIPVMAKFLKNVIGGGGEICLLMIASSCLLELVCTYTHISEWLYRLLFFRYFFLIYLGYLWGGKGIYLNRNTLFLSIISILFILLFTYTSINFEPFFFRTDWKINHWICYFYTAYLFIFFLKFCYNHLNEKIKLFICQMGKYSNEIFLLQMFVFTFFPYEKLSGIVENEYAYVVLRVLFTTTLSILPVIGWKKMRLWLNCAL